MPVSKEEQKKFDSNPCRFIDEKIRKYVTESPKNRFPDGTPVFDEPLVGFADGDDTLFHDYKKIIGDFHLTPREALSKHLQSKGIKDIKEPQSVSAIVWILPITLNTRLSLRKETRVTSVRWNRTRVYGEELNKELSLYVVSLLEELGHRAVAPMYSSFFKWEEFPSGWASNWSIRHAAYVAGLGTFSINDGFITPRGIAMRCGSAVVDMVITPTPRVYKDHMANCLFYSEESCRRCIERCPAGAITEKGHDKRKCRYYVDNIQPAILKEEGRDKDYIFSPTAGCGLCQTKVPCESMIPPVSQKR